MMAYVTLEDDSGSMELLAFQKALDAGGGYIADNAALVVSGRISVRDEKEAQVMVDTIRPLSDLGALPAASAHMQEKKEQRKLFLRMDSTNTAGLRRLELLLSMFPGEDTLVTYFPNLKKQRSARCVIHDALVDELKERFGDENVVIK